MAIIWLLSTNQLEQFQFGTITSSSFGLSLSLHLQLNISIFSIYPHHQKYIGKILQMYKCAKILWFAFCERTTEEERNKQTRLFLDLSSSTEWSRCWMDRKVLSDTSLDIKITALFINLSCSGKRKKGKIMIFDNWLKYSDIKSSWSKYEKTSMFMPWFISQYSIRGVQTPKLPQHHHCYTLKLGPWIYCFKIKDKKFRSNI